MLKNKLNKTTNLTTSELNHHSPQSRRSRALTQALPTSQRRWNSFSQAVGFTIIEVILVLAIAGLIFLMVFIALPALQRSQRDSLRRRHAQSVADAASRALINNRTLLGRTWYIDNLIARGYLKEDEIRDPSTGEVYRLDPANSGGDLYANYQNIQPGYYGADSGLCRGNNPSDTAGSGSGREGMNRVFIFGLESGGWVCASNVMK